MKLTAPKERLLKKGKAYEFILESNEIAGVYLYVDDEESIPFAIEGSKYKYILNSKTAGTYGLIISNQNEELFKILEYVIE